MKNLHQKLLIIRNDDLIIKFDEYIIISDEMTAHAAYVKVAAFTT